MAIQEQQPKEVSEPGSSAATVVAVEDSPIWDATPSLTVARCEAAFEHTVPFTVGAEEELMLVEPDSLDLAPAIDDVLPLLAGDRRFCKELRAAQIETVT